MMQIDRACGVRGTDGRIECRRVVQGIVGHTFIIAKIAAVRVAAGRRRCSGQNTGTGICRGRRCRSRMIIGGRFIDGLDGT